MSTITQKFRSRTGLFAAALLALGVAACTATGSARGSGGIKNPVGNDIEWEFAIGNDGTVTGTTTGLPPGKCLETTWSGADGSDVGSTTTPIDSTGTATGQVPEGAVRFSAKVVDCPEEEEKSEADSSQIGNGGGGMFDPLAQGGGVTQNPGGVAQQRVAIGAKDYVCYGAPIFPEGAVGAENTVYLFIVRAFSQDQADALTESVLDAGIGAPVPASVKIVEFNQTIPTMLGGARFVSANPDGFLDWRFDFNNGAHVADIATGQNVLNYQIGSWDVMETVIPFGAFNYTILPGASYENGGVLSSATTRYPQVGDSSYSFLNFAE